MPSELPNLPRDTYESLLRRQHAPGLQLQAGEVATYRRKRSPAVPIAAILIGLGLMILGATL